MKLYLQISNLEEPEPEPDDHRAAYSSIAMDTKAMALPLDEFVERYLKPMFVNARQTFEGMKKE